MSEGRKTIYLQGGPFDGRRLGVKSNVSRLTMTTIGIGEALVRAKDVGVVYEEAMYQSTDRRMDDGTIYFEYLEQV